MCRVGLFGGLVGMGNAYATTTDFHSCSGHYCFDMTSNPLWIIYRFPPYLLLPPPPPSIHHFSHVFPLMWSLCFIPPRTRMNVRMDMHTHVEGDSGRLVLWHALKANCRRWPRYTGQNLVRRNVISTFAIYLQVHVGELYTYISHIFIYAWFSYMYIPTAHRETLYSTEILSPVCILHNK